MFRYHIGTLPDVFVSFFTCNRNIHQYATRQSHQLHYPKFKTELGKRSLAFWGVKIWNTILKTDISLEVEPLTFKIHLKRLLLNDVLHIIDNT